MKDLITLANDQVQNPKSVLDMTPFELAEIERYESRNRVFKDDDAELENDYNWED